MIHFVLLCELSTGKPVERPSHGHQTSGFAWFAETELPDSLDPGHAVRIPKAFGRWRNGGSSYFDRP